MNVVSVSIPSVLYSKRSILSNYMRYLSHGYVIMDFSLINNNYYNLQVSTPLCLINKCIIEIRTDDTQCCFVIEINKEKNIIIQMTSSI